MAGFAEVVKKVAARAKAAAKKPDR